MDNPTINGIRQFESRTSKRYRYPLNSKTGSLKAGVAGSGLRGSSEPPDPSQKKCGHCGRRQNECQPTTDCEGQVDTEVHIVDISKYRERAKNE
jgi:hypothetical protein